MKAVKRILLLGANGQIGGELCKELPQALPDAQLIATTRAQLDITDSDALVRTIRVVKPNLIINVAAYNAVDRAEKETHLAQRVNAEAVGVIASEAKRVRALLIHFSSNYVFDGKSPAPYIETDMANPVNSYGESKVNGEMAIEHVGAPALILRTSWVYSAIGINFFRAMLHRAAISTTLTVVDDQFGTPNAAGWLAAITAQLCCQPLGWLKERSGLYHLTANGYTSWFGFAQAIFKRYGEQAPRELLPISTKDYVSASQPMARRPAFGVLSALRFADTFAITLPDWQEVFDQMTDYRKDNVPNNSLT